MRLQPLGCMKGDPSFAQGRSKTGQREAFRMARVAGRARKRAPLGPRYPKGG
jgi:hypothetical protein